MPTDLSYLYPMFPILGGIGCLLCFIPIPWHCKAGNVAVVALGFWILGMNIIFWVGTIVWHGNIENPYPIWGDIVNVFMAMFPTGSASATLCVQYRLWQLARARNVFISKKDKRRRRYSTWALCLGLPLLVAPIHYVVEGHRYNLFEDLGPIIATYNVVLAFPLFFIIDPTLCIIEAVFAVLTIRIYLTNRKEIDLALTAGSSNVNKNHFVRLLCLSGLALFVHLPLSLWVLIGNAAAYQVEPWISWDDTHSNYGRIVYANRYAIQQSHTFVISTLVVVYATALCAFNYFFLFGFGEEAKKHYKSFIGTILRPFGIQYSRKKKHAMIKRTWHGILLGRLGKAANSSTPTPSMRHLDPNPSKFFRLSKPDSLFSQTTTTGGDDVSIDMTNLDSVKGRTGLDSTLEQGTHPRNHGGDSVIEGESSDHRGECEKSEVTSEISTSNRGEDGDLEVQEPTRSDGQAARRRAILEKYPELTEEVTF